MSNTIYTVDDIKKALFPVLNSYNVKKAILFGSYAKGQATENINIDLLLDSGLRGLKFIGLIEDVKNILNKNVDVFDVTHIMPNSKISSEINKYGVVIYQK